MEEKSVSKIGIKEVSFMNNQKITADGQKIMKHLWTLPWLLSRKGGLRWDADCKEYLDFVSGLR
jgi:hypothetical protein